MTDARNFLLNSDYPIDQLMLLVEGSAIVPDMTDDSAAGSTGILIPHSLPFTPLPMIVWSNTSDFNIANTWVDADMALTFDTTRTGQEYNVFGRPNDIAIDRYNRSGSAKTLYYRIICFAPSDADINSEVAPTALQDNNFILNSDYNYMKLLKNGKLTVDSPVYTHGLGRTPRVFVWQKIDNIYNSLIYTISTNIDPTGSLGFTSGVYVDDSVIKRLNSAFYPEIEYRLYVD